MTIGFERARPAQRLSRGERAVRAEAPSSRLGGGQRDVGSIRQYLGAVVSSVGLQICGALLRLAVTATIASQLGAAGLGRFTFYASIAAIIMLAGRAGLPTFLAREISRLQAQREVGLCRGLIVFAFGALALNVMQIFAVLIVLWLIFGSFGLSLPVMMVAYFAAAGEALVAINMNILIAARYPKLGLGLSNVATPSIFLALTGACLGTGVQLSVERLLALSLCGSALAGVAGLVLVARLFLRRFRHARREMTPRRWLKALLPFAINDLAVEGRAHIPNFFLGAMLSAEAVGYFRIAQVLNGLAVFQQLSLVPILRHEAARLWHNGEKDALARLMTLAARGLTISGVAILALIAIAGRDLIRLVFGTDFGPAYGAVQMLVIGTVAASAAGFPGILLSMTGFPERTAKINLATGGAQLVLMPLLIAAFGLAGATGSMALVMTGGALALAMAARASTGIDPSALGQARRQQI